MSAVIATPELMDAAATDLASIGSTVNAAHMVAAAPTVAVLPAAADEVSAGIAHLFSSYAQDYQKLVGKAAAFQEQFVQHLTASAGAYASAEAANVASLLKPLTVIAAPVAAATAAQSTLQDLITNLATNTAYVLGAAAVAGVVIGFLSWLMADLVVLYLASAATTIVKSFPLYGLILNVLTDAINPLLTAFPVVGQLASAGTQLAQSVSTEFFWPVTFVAQILRALYVLNNPLGQAAAS